MANRRAWSRSVGVALGDAPLRQSGLRRARRRDSRLDVDGVGLLRAEFMVTDALGGVHPKLLIERGDQKVFIDKMAASLLRITKAFGSRPVVYRSIDFRTMNFPTSRAVRSSSQLKIIP